MENRFLRDLFVEFRHLAAKGVLAALLPLPVLLIHHGPTADGACVALGLCSAGLASETFHPLRRRPDELVWCTRIVALLLILSANAALFTIVGRALAVESQLPIGVWAALSVVPALGLIPWLVLRLRERFPAIVFTIAIVGTTKLFGCILARFVYGPNALRDGFMDADWRTAPLMLSAMWSGAILVSLFGLRQSYRLCAMSDDLRLHARSEAVG